MNVFVKELLPSRTETATDNSGTLILGSEGDRLGLISGAHRVRMSLDVSAASGTSPTLDVTVSAVENGRTIPLDQFTQATAVTRETRIIEIVPNNVLIDWVIGGTGPSFTFSIDAYLEN